MEHLSDREVFQFLDKETSEVERIEILKHLDECQRCCKRMNILKMYLFLINDSISNEQKTINMDSCLNQNQLNEYISKNLDQEQTTSIETHLSICISCRERFIDEINPYDPTKEIALPATKIDEAMQTVNGRIRQNKVKQLIDKLTNAISTAPKQTFKFLDTIKNKFEESLLIAFNETTPCFPAVFGTGHSDIISPFGKTKFPIVFEWQSYNDEKNNNLIYHISIKDIDWSVSTTDTSILIEEDEISLNYGQEYMWEFKVKNPDGIIAEKIGYFELLSKDELEELKIALKFISQIEPAEDKHILIGQLLDYMGLYIDAIKHYQKSYQLNVSSAIAYKIAYCYDKLELQDLKDEWNKKIDSYNSN